jgi:hypothetical protein
MTAIGLRYLLLVDLWINRSLINVYRVQQDMLAATDWPRSPLVMDRIAELEGKISDIEVRLILGQYFL